MRNSDRGRIPTKKRKGDTGRTSSEGRKLASGGRIEKRQDNKEVDDATNSPIKEIRHQPRKRRS